MGRGAESIYCRYIKRALDILLSALLIFFLCLPMLIIAIAVRSESEGGAIFKQTRRGRGGKEFVCYKFRTMYAHAPKNMPASRFADHEKYVTRVGGFLRKSSLDELPQLFNVIRGDMSIVGPRPLICEEEQMHEGRLREGVYNIRPGITGLAQISGRNYLRDEEKLKQDSIYLSDLRLLLDAKIILSTLKKVITHEGVGH
ncbi:MAG: sugar transferase [Clostridia bacterium]|nr:sugar transferase [Clostridia bacterium]MBR2613075.1 sugar transferase [Clostridia bacterium]